MKRLIMLIGLVVLIIAGIVASLPLFVSSSTVRGYIVSQLTSLTGRDVSFHGDPRVSFSPFLGLEISDLEISDPQASEGENPLLHVSKVQAQLDILPALLGEIKITQYRLVRPELNMKIYLDGTSNWHFREGQLRDAFEQALNVAQSGEQDSEVSATLGTFAVVDGVIKFEDTISGLMEDITSINGSIGWPTTSAPASISGTAIWHGENVEISAVAAEPMLLMAGGQSATEWQFKSAPVTMGFSGNANTLSSLFIKGKIDLQTPSVRRLSDFVDTDLTGIHFPGAIRISGNIEATADAIRVTETEADIAGHPASGVLSLSIDEVGNASLDGTLAFDTIDLTGYLMETAENIEELSLPPDADGVNVDLRISANTIDAGSVELKQVAAAVNVAGSYWTFDIGDSQIFGGTLVAKIGKRDNEGTSLILMEATGNDFDTEALFGLFPESSIGISGKVKIAANLRSKNLTGLMNMDGLNGVVTANMTDGTVQGIDMNGLLAMETEEQNSDIDEAQLGGGTSFQNANFKLFIHNGVASLSQSEMNNDTTAIRLQGRVDLRQGNLALRAQKVTEGEPEAERLFIGGTLNAPLVSLKKSGLRQNSNEIKADTADICN